MAANSRIKSWAAATIRSRDANNSWAAAKCLTQYTRQIIPTCSKCNRLKVKEWHCKKRQREPMMTHQRFTTLMQPKSYAKTGRMDIAIFTASHLFVLVGRPRMSEHLLDNSDCDIFVCQRIIQHSAFSIVCSTGG